MEKIKFISPSDPEIKKSASAEYYPPLGLLQIATHLKEQLPNLDIEVIDQGVDKRSLENLLKADVVGVSMLTPNALMAEKIIQKAKEQGAITIAGNDHASQRATQLLKNVPELDYILRGDYTEKPLVKLFKQILAGEKDLEKIPGLSYKSDSNNIVHNPEEDYPPEDISYADRSLINPYHQEVYSKNYKDAYGKHHNKKIKQTSINIAQGCERCLGSKCFFCGIEDIRLRNTLPQKAIKEIQYLYETFGYNYLYVIADDLTSFGKPVRGYQSIFLKDLAEGWPFKDGEVEIYAYAKADNLMDKRILNYLKQLNVSRLNVGFESGSPKMLKNFMKAASVNINREATKILREEGIQLHTSIVLGGIGESKETIEETKEFIKEIIEMSKIDNIRNNIVAIEPALLFPIFNSLAWKCMTDYNTASEFLKRAGMEIDQQKLKSIINKYQILNEKQHVFNSEELVKDWVNTFCKIDYDKLQENLVEIKKIIASEKIHTGTYSGTEK
ncbi:MAG: radical SAM protein [Nanoarchaeota archaeon]